MDERWKVNCHLLAIGFSSANVQSAKVVGGKLLQKTIGDYHRTFLEFRIPEFAEQFRRHRVTGDGMAVKASLEGFVFAIRPKAAKLDAKLLRLPGVFGRPRGAI